MADLPLLAERLFNRPHLVLPGYAETVASVLAHRLRVQPMLSAEEVKITQRPARSPVMTKDGVMVIPIVGGLYHRGDGLDAISGAQSYTNLQNMIVAALASEDVKGILLDIDSPGGQASGCFEFCDMLIRAREKKPIWAIANAMAASAGYAIASSANKLYVTPSGQVGSIGVVFMHVDLSKALAEAGVAVTYIYAGKHKIDGNPHQPLPDEVKADIKREIDARYESFVSLVAARRTMTEKEIRKTEAAMFSPEKAVELGLADEIASFDKVMSDFVLELNPRYSVSKTGEVTRMSQASAPVATGPKIEGLQEALTRAYEDGAAAATTKVRAEMNEAVIASYVKGRTDAAAIVSAEAAKGKPEAAARLAGNSKLTVDEAVEMLATIPAGDATGSGFKADLKKNDPKVPAGNSQAPAASSPVDDWQSSVAHHVHQMLRAKAQ